MTTFNVYQHATRGNEAVKVGFSWPGFFFTWIWMLIKRLWGLAIGWIAIWIVINIMFSVVGNAGYTGGPSPIGLLALAGFLGLHLVPGFMGNKWREADLVKRGYKHVGVRQAETPDAAVASASDAGA